MRETLLQGWRGAGPYAANRALQHFRAVYNSAARRFEELPDRPPTVGVTFNKVRRRREPISWPELPEWRERVEAVDNPIRRDLHPRRDRSVTERLGEALEALIREHLGLVPVWPRVAPGDAVMDDPGRAEVPGEEQHGAAPVPVQRFGSKQPEFAWAEPVRRDVARHVGLGNPVGERGRRAHCGFIDTGQGWAGPAFRPTPAGERPGAPDTAWQGLRAAEPGFGEGVLSPREGGPGRLIFLTDG